MSDEIRPPETAPAAAPEGPPEPPPEPVGATVTPIEDARRHRDEAEGAPAEEPTEAPSSVQIRLNELLAPVVASIAQEMVRFADKDGVVRMTDDVEQNRQKTAAILKGVGNGLGAAIAQAFARWAANVETPGQAEEIVAATPPAGPTDDATPAPAGDSKGPSGTGPSTS